MKEKGDIISNKTITNNVAQERLNTVLDNVVTPEFNDTYVNKNSSSIELRLVLFQI